SPRLRGEGQGEGDSRRTQYAESPPHPAAFAWLRRPTSPRKAGRGKAQFIVIVEKSTNQLFGCTKFLIFGLSARGPTSWATHRKAASSTERSCSAASALSRAVASNVCRAVATRRSNSGSLM